MKCNSSITISSSEGRAVNNGNYENMFGAGTAADHFLRQDNSNQGGIWRSWRQQQGYPQPYVCGSPCPQSSSTCNSYHQATTHRTVSASALRDYHQPFGHNLQPSPPSTSPYFGAPLPTFGYPPYLGPQYPATPHSQPTSGLRFQCSQVPLLASLSSPQLAGVGDNGDNMYYPTNSNVNEAKWRGNPLQYSMGACVTSEGFISVRLRHNVQLDFTLDKAIRLYHYDSGIIMSLSSCGTRAALIHPSGRVYHYGNNDSRVELSVNDQHDYATYGKIWQKGVTFSSDKCSLVYLIDMAGIRSTTDSFSDMWSGDFTLPTFLNGSAHEPICISACARLISTIKYWKNKDGNETWVINGFRITQEADGNVRVARDLLKYQLRLNPTTGNCLLITPNLYCTSSSDGRISAKRGDKRIIYDGSNFVVRHGSHSGGFDHNTQLKLY